MVTDLPDYSKKVIVVYEGTIISGEVKVDHVKIKGLTLKDPYVALCIPSSIENPALAYEALTDRFKVKIEDWEIASIVADISDKWARQLGQVDIARVLGAAMSHSNPLYTRISNGSAFIDPRDRNWTITEALDISDDVARELGLVGLKTGSNTIGKLAANSGIDIGDVDILSIAAGDNNIGNVDVVTLPALPTGTNSIGKLTQSTLHDSKVYAPAVFDASASGNLVAAVADKVTKLHAITIQAQGTVVVNLNNGSGGASLMEWSLQAREGAVISMANAPAYWAKTSVNTALYVTLSAAVQVTITAIVSSDDAS